MDQGLISWAHRVKRPGRPPPLWLFTDAARMPDLLGLVRRLPAGLCGVVFRHDAAPDRLALGLQLARICRARRLVLVVAGDARLAARLAAGLHMRGGRRPGLTAPLKRRLISASAHNAVELYRARRAGASILFCSPVFPTLSHPGAAALGPLGYARLARRAAPAPALALGGVTGRSVRLLGKSCTGAGAIEAFLCNEARGVLSPNRK